MASYSQVLCEHSSWIVQPGMLSLFLVGAVVMRGAGCTINDLWDRKIDAQVVRTRDRPLASGKLSTGQAVAFLAGQLTVGLAVLLQLDFCSIALGSVALLPVAIYPFMKRITYWPQLMLGVAFNWGALLGMPSTLALSSAAACSALWADCLPVTMPLYLGGILWTLVYDTIYAHQDKLDDRRIGVKSTALRFGSNTTWVLSGFALGTIFFWNAAAFFNHQSVYFHVSMTSFISWHFYRQIWKTNYDVPAQCLARFKSNHILGLGLFILLLSDTLWLYYHKNESKSDQIS